MNAVRRVLVAIDFSPGSDMAVERAMMLAQLHGARLDLLHAFDVRAWHALQAVFDVHRLSGEVPSDVALRERLSALAESLAARSGLDVAAQFGLGEPAAAIVSQVEARHAAVVVLARRSDPETPGVGGTLLRVLHRAPCPVLVVKVPPARGYERVLSAVDLREVSRRAAAAAVELFPAAAHRLLCAVDPAWERELWRRAAAPGQTRVEGPSLHATAMQLLDALAQPLALHVSGKLDTEVVDAAPVRAIVDRAAAWPADCVVVGRHGQGRLADRLLGSTALDLIHHTGGDVLVVS